MSIAVRCIATGNYRDVLRVEHQEAAQLGPGQVLVELIAAPVHPADINAIEGRYGRHIPPPFTPGNEGVGRIITLGPGVPECLRGARVLLPYASGTWCTHSVLPYEVLHPVIFQELDDLQAAQALINPLTALRLLELAPARQGHAVVYNAANSAVGRCITTFAQARGLRAIALARDAQNLRHDADESLQIFADSDELTPQAIRNAAAGAPLALALNAVGGQSALRLAAALDDAGTHVTYGAMSRQPMKIPASLLIFRNIYFRGFWLNAWLSQASYESVQRDLRVVFEAMASGQLHLPVAAVYPLADVVEAVSHAQREHRGGKVLLVPS